MQLQDVVQAGPPGVVLRLDRARRKVWKDRVRFFSKGLTTVILVLRSSVVSSLYLPMNLVLSSLPAR